MNSNRNRLILISILTVLGLYAITPTVIYFSLPKDQRNDEKIMSEATPSWAPKKHIKLGLDLQGGVQLVLGVDTSAAIENKLGRIATEIARWANEKKPQVKTAYAIKGQETMRIELEPGVDVGQFKIDMKKEFFGLSQTNKDDQKLDFKYTEEQLSSIREAALEQAERVVRNRIDKWGVSEPQISRRADKNIMVQLPGFRNPERAKELLGKTAQLKFKMANEDFDGFSELAKNLPENITSEARGNFNGISFVSEDKDALIALLKDKIPEGNEILFEEEAIAGGNKTLYKSHLLFASTELSGEDVLEANVTTDTSSFDQRPVVSLQFTGVGGKRFADLTGANIKKRMAIILDDVVVSDPSINQRISGGNAQITLGSEGGFQKIYEEAQQLALILKSGALPAPITILEERQVGATLGPELANQGVTSVGLGLILVLFFMIIYYRRPGMLSCVALVLNGLFLLAMMASFGFALTLPGFAGFILTLGMAVDANVLINERIKQELKEGANSKKAVEIGFKKVFWTIIDANVTTLIAALVLLETNSSGPIKGFAVALVIGLLVSMFTSLYCTKAMFNWVIFRDVPETKLKAWLAGGTKLVPSTGNRNFLKYGKLAAGIGLAISLTVVAATGVKGINWSVDFAGGLEMELLFKKEVDSDTLRKTIASSNAGSHTLQAVGSENKQYIVRFENPESSTGEENTTTNAESTAKVQNLKSDIIAKLKEFEPEVQRVDFVGPLIGKELRTQGILSVLWAIIGVIIYIGLRFDMRFGPGAVFKMAQDIFVIMGFYVFFGRSFDLTSVAALLTVVGYSVNDTIVIYDRIRENLIEKPRNSLFDNINISVNETLTRSINTSVTTIIALAGILVFASSQIWNFAAAMAIGVIAATLSSIFLATSFVLWLEKWKTTRKAKLGQAA